MDLSWRPALSHDFAGCLRLLKGHAAYEQAFLAILPEIWLRLFLARERLVQPDVNSATPTSSGLVETRCLRSRDPSPRHFILYVAPRFAFTNGLRELLGRALRGETDTMLAKSLSISLSTVKSRWRAIYRKVDSSSRRG
jgi:DNA-binding NarL/FixJ family response regulator